MDHRDSAALCCEDATVLRESLLTLRIAAGDCSDCQRTAGPSRFMACQAAGRLEVLPQANDGECRRRDHVQELLEVGARRCRHVDDILILHRKILRRELKAAEKQKSS